MIQEIIGLHTCGASTRSSSSDSITVVVVHDVVGVGVVVVGCGCCCSCCSVVRINDGSSSIAEWLRFSTGMVMVVIMMVMVVMDVIQIETIVSDRFVMATRTRCEVRLDGRDGVVIQGYQEPLPRT